MINLVPKIDLLTKCNFVSSVVAEISSIVFVIWAINLKVTSIVNLDSRVVLKAIS